MQQRSVVVVAALLAAVVSAHRGPRWWLANDAAAGDVPTDTVAAAARLQSAERGRHFASASPPPPAPAARRQLGLYVTDFGAVGDGTSDDTAAIQAAINEAMHRRRCVLFPAGTYTVNATLQAAVGMGALCLRGEGKLLSIIRVANTAASAEAPLPTLLNISYDAASYHESTRLEISDVTFGGSRVVTDVVLAKLLTRSTFERVFFDGGLRSGLWLNGWIVVVNQCNFGGSGASADRSGAGLVLAGNNMVVTASAFEGNIGAGIDVTWGNQVSITDNVIEGNDGPGLLVHKCRGCALERNYFEENCVPGPCSVQLAADLNVSMVVDIVVSWFRVGAGVMVNQGLVIGESTFAPHTRQPASPSYPITAIAMHGTEGAIVRGNAASSPQMSLLWAHATAVNAGLRLEGNNECENAAWPLCVVVATDGVAATSTTAPAAAAAMTTWADAGLRRSGALGEAPRPLAPPHHVPLAPLSQWQAGADTVVTASTNWSWFGATPLMIVASRSSSHAATLNTATPVPAPLRPGLCGIAMYCAATVAWAAGGAAGVSAANVTVTIDLVGGGGAAVARSRMVHAPTDDSFVGLTTVAAVANAPPCNSGHAAAAGSRVTAVAMGVAVAPGAPPLLVERVACAPVGAPMSELPRS